MEDDSLDSDYVEEESGEDSSEDEDTIRNPTRMNQTSADQQKGCTRSGKPFTPYA